MAAGENIKRINGKTQIFFFVTFFTALIIFLGIAFFQYSRNNFNPRFDKNAKFITDKNITERCHKKFMASYIFNTTVSLFLKNIFLVSLIFFCFNYSLVITRGDLITTDGKNIMFPDIVRQGLYILAFLTVCYYLSIDIILPRSEKRLGWINEVTYDTIVILDRANKLYFSNNLEDALYYYDEYINIINDDRSALDRIRSIRNNLSYGEFGKEKNKKNPEVSLPKGDYFELANYFFNKKDYDSAWYYYAYVAQNDSVRRNEALEKIESIKKIFQYENSLKTESQKRSMSSLMQYIDKKQRDIQDIYLLKKKAGDLRQNREYQKAYFIYDDILKINPNLGDVAADQAEVYRDLSGIGVETTQADRIKILPGKTDFVFMKDKNTLIQFGKIVKTFDYFYVYDVKIVDFDNNFNIKDVIYAPYGRTLNLLDVKNRNVEKTADKLTLYSFSKNDRENEYMPVMVNFSSQSKKTYPDYVINLPANLEIFYDFSYDYNKTLGFSLIKLFMLKNLTKDRGQNISIGLNTDFIKTAILDKISRIFLFFSICLIFIGLAWRLKSTYLGNIPALHFVLMLALPVFLYYFVYVLRIFISSFYSVLILAGGFNMVLIITFAINIVIMICSIIYIAASK